MEKDNSKKIVHILWSFGNGGMENLVKNILLNKKNTTKNKLIIINKNIDENTINGIPDNQLIKIGRNKGSKNIFKILKLYINLIKINPDIVHIHYYNLINILKPLSYLIQFKIILTIHGMDDFDKSITKAKKVIAVSNSHFNHIKKRLDKEKISTKNLRMIYNGINIEDSFVQSKNFNSPLKFFVVGRLNHKQKKQDLIIDIFNSFLKINPEIKLSFFGDGLSKKYLQNKCKEYNISDKISFEGSVENKELIKKIKNYDIMISAADYETFGINIIESLYFGIPVISYNSTTANEVAKDNPIAMFYNTSGELLSILNSLPKEISYDERMASKKMVEKRYNIDNTIKEYNNIYMTEE